MPVFEVRGPLLRGPLFFPIVSPKRGRRGGIAGRSHLREPGEASRDRAAGLADTHVSVVSNRMNEVMKVLTIVGAIFIPLSFLAGVFGMNSEPFPGLGRPHAFRVFTASCVAIAVGMLGGVPVPEVAVTGRRTGCRPGAGVLCFGGS